MAARVAMTAMPELVAILHSFVGLAAVLVGIVLYPAAEAVSGTSSWGSKSGSMSLSAPLLLQLGFGLLS